MVDGAIPRPPALVSFLSLGGISPHLLWLSLPRSLALSLSASLFLCVRVCVSLCLCVRASLSLSAARSLLLVCECSRPYRRPPSPHQQVGCLGAVRLAATIITIAPVLAVARCTLAATRYTAELTGSTIPPHYLPYLTLGGTYLPYSPCLLRE